MTCFDYDDTFNQTIFEIGVPSTLSLEAKKMKLEFPSKK